jgi:hypothetical protein
MTGELWLDTLSRALARGAPRRDLLRLAAGALVALVGGNASTTAVARKGRKRGRGKPSNQCSASGNDRCDPAAEYNRRYVGTPETCTVIRFLCIQGTTYFSNCCGCGCEQDETCPPFFDCMPIKTCDTADLQRRCPFSTIAV